jgi:hypothetical protein
MLNIVGNQYGAVALMAQFQHQNLCLHSLNNVWKGCGSLFWAIVAS